LRDAASNATIAAEERQHAMAVMDKPSGSGRSGWKQDPSGVQRNILAVAMAEFAANGLSGARIDEIAAKTHTSKRMIYYYFGDKDGLYRRVLEEAYRKVRAGEQELELDHLPPVAALQRLAEFTFDHHSRNPDFIRIVMIENIHHGAYLEQSDLIRLLNAGAIQSLEAICRRGCDAGLFRDDVSPLELHWHISAMSFFNVSNRATFSRIFGNALFAPKGQRALRRHLVEMVVGLALKPDQREPGGRGG
jgi:AcrR family transcriptional regulator